MPRLPRIASAEPRRAATVTLPAPLLEEARLRQECWRADYRQAIDAWNEHVAAHGLPLAADRQF